MNFVLDTNILIHALRKSSIYTDLNRDLSFFDIDNTAFISSVTIGELYSFAFQNKWGSVRISNMEALLKKLIPVPVEKENLILAYANIDAFSNGKHPNIPLGTSARNMGKNDLWIAATTLISKSTLITMDNDFNHLHNVFFKVISV